jgi:hypothetical protein
LFLILAAVPCFAQVSGVPTYLNAEIVRVDRAAGTATVRSESGDVVLTADGRALGLLALRPGEKVIVAYETMVDDSGRTRRMVTYARPASPGSGEPGPSLASATGGSASFSSTVRVVSTDRGRRRITVTDASGVPMVLPVSSGALASLGGLSAGDVVGLNFTNGGIVSANALPSVSAIQGLPAGTAVGGAVLPPLSGQFVSFDARTNMLTVQNAAGRQRSFPVNPSVGANFANLRTGDNLSLNFQLTDFARSGAAAGNFRAGVTPAGLSSPAILAVNNVQPLTPGFVQQGPNSFATLPGVGNATPLSAQQMGVANAGRGNIGTSPNIAGAGTAAAAAGTGTAGAATAGNPAGAGAGNANVNQAGFPTSTPFVGGTGVAGPVSPFLSTVPSLPSVSSAAPVYAAVLPPAVAKAPFNEEEVGLMRAYGERDLDAAAVVLAAAANQVDVIWAGYKNTCLGGFIPESSPSREWFLALDGRVRTSTDDQCRSMLSSLISMATAWEDQLGIALDAARHADVLPGRIRETLQRHRIDR